MNSVTYAIVGATGNCGTALIKILLQREGVLIHAYCRNRAKLLRLLQDVDYSGRVTIFEGSMHNVELLGSCLHGCRAAFLVASTNDNIPGCRVGQDTAVSIIKALKSVRISAPATLVMPKLVLLSSATIDKNFSRHAPFHS